MRYIFYGNMKVKTSVYLEKQSKNYSNGSAMQVKTLTLKQFKRASKKWDKILEKRRKSND